MTDIKRVFTVDGKPFFPLGGQARNSSGYNDTESEHAFRALKALHGNTLEIPVYWEQVEPTEGTFDFAPVDSLLALARRYGVKLILLWFASWKNGDMDYTPAWVKTNPARFHRVTAPSGKTIWNLSAHCDANVEADRKAFRALCQHLASADAAERTVIAIQIQNEPGILGSDRDYGPDGEAAFRSPVPAELIGRLRAAGSGPLFDVWTQAGAKQSGAWPEVFGWTAGETMTAWAIATYIERIAEAGKAVLDIPMYVNAWLGEVEWRVAGDSYPSGGAVTWMIDVYKWFAPHVDVIAPDIYVTDARGYDEICAGYARPDNPLFVPESANGGTNALLLFRAIADHNAIAYFFFNVERILEADGTIQPGCRQIVDSFRSVAAAIPLLLKYQGTGKVFPIVQEEGLPYGYLDLDGYIGMVQCEGIASRPPHKDWRHASGQVARTEATVPERGRGLIFQVSRHELYLVGASYRLLLRPKLPPEQSLDTTVARDWLMPRLRNFVTVEEGHFDADGAFVADRRRNGDETDYGLWVEPDVSVLHVVLTE
jgi:hypothetical protein